MPQIEKLPAWNHEMSAEDRVLLVLYVADRSMTQHEITASIALWKSRDITDALLSMLLKGGVTATFTGGPEDNAEDEDNYEFSVPQSVPK